MFYESTVLISKQSTTLSCDVLYFCCLYEGTKCIAIKFLIYTKILSANEKYVFSMISIVQITAIKFEAYLFRRDFWPKICCLIFSSGPACSAGKKRSCWSWICAMTRLYPQREGSMATRSSWCILLRPKCINLQPTKIELGKKWDKFLISTLSATVDFPIVLQQPIQGIGELPNSFQAFQASQ